MGKGRRPLRGVFSEPQYGYAAGSGAAAAAANKMLGSDDEDDHDEAQESAMRAKEENSSTCRRLHVANKLGLLGWLGETSV